MSILAPVATKNERLLSYIERGQSDNALGLLLEMQDAAAESSEAIPPEAILMASSKGFSDVVDALLDSGADIEAREVAPAFTGRTPLLLGSAGGFPRVVEVLLARGADHEARDADGMDAIALASSRELREVVVSTLDGI